jgi:hypothetical protein
MVGDGDDLFERGVVESLFELPDKLVPTAWSGHIPFLFALFRLARPCSFVELGVHHGACLIAACTATRIYATETVCFGVDTWRGDAHAGDYSDHGDEVHGNLNDFLAGRYSFVTLVRSRFDEALETFSDTSVDMVHIDGLHTYEAVKHDFETWLPKLSRRGIVLFHDIGVRERDFGVWKLWEDLSPEYPSMEFYHGFGLGVLFVGEDQPPSILKLMDRWRNNIAFRECFRATVENVGAQLPARVQARAYKQIVEELAGLQAAMPRLRNIEQAALDLTRKSRYWKLFWPILRYGQGFRNLERSVRD